MNKSYLMAAFAATLVILGKMERVELDWLVAGHTKFSPDRLFGTFSKILKRSVAFASEDVDKRLNDFPNRHGASLLSGFSFFFFLFLFFSFFLLANHSPSI